MMEYIRNDNCKFVYVDENGEKHESSVAINTIIWGNELVCQNCRGSISGEGKCSGCDDPTPVIEEGIVERSFLGKASVELEALLPEGAFIFNPPARFEARYRRYMRSSTIESMYNWDTRLIFHTEHIYKRTIKAPVILHCEDVSRVSIKVVLRTDVILENRKLVWRVK